MCVCLLSKKQGDEGQRRPRPADLDEVDIEDIVLPCEVVDWDDWSRPRGGRLLLGLRGWRDGGVEGTDKQSDRIH